MGPLCSEPRILNNQLQQVQLMKDDFASQTTLLNKMDKLGDSLLERLDSSHPEARKIKSKKDEIHDKWQRLANILAERERSLQAVKDAANDFQNKYDKLVNALHKISDEFDRITNSGADNDEQLLKLTNLEESLDMQRPALADLESACEKLCDLLTDNASKNEVRNRVAGVRKMFDELQQKINNRKTELQSILKEDKEFYFNCEAMQEWLKNMHNRLARDFRVSANLPKLTRQVTDYEPLYREVLAKEHEIHILITKGNQLQRRLTRKEDISQVKAKMDAIKQQYDKLKEDATNQHTKLAKCFDLCTRFRQAVDAFVPWLSQMESRVKQFNNLILLKDKLEKVFREFQVSFFQMLLLRKSKLTIFLFLAVQK